MWDVLMWGSETENGTHTCTEDKWGLKWRVEWWKQEVRTEGLFGPIWYYTGSGRITTSYENTKIQQRKGLRA